MRINPTFPGANEVVKTWFIPRKQFWTAFNVAVWAFVITNHFKTTGLTFAVCWFGFFLASLKDPCYTTLLWRSMWREPVLTLGRVTKRDRRRFARA